MEMNMIMDIVNGIVIGDITYRAELHQPKGGIYGQPKSFGSYEEAKLWASELISKVRQDNGDVECKRLGYDKQWELRFFDVSS